VRQGYRIWVHHGDTEGTEKNSCWAREPACAKPKRLRFGEGRARHSSLLRDLCVSVVNPSHFSGRTPFPCLKGPYEVGTPALFSFAEWNGRPLTDNAPDVMFSIAANAPVRLGIGKESVTAKPSKAFPYVPAVS
jgi:hypothetical protein